ncbi:hypothetical protein IU450_38045 [Nocardia abscessus]|uniref:hypothetical protein n=1 Tax=Nocardia abscessus TaxID=120957 RepID=UPI001896034F|nr:hypothetical protein [Nocardia abscessus]MBF6341639.1 hypothetical protein [Nocardia abscessus]
MLTNSEFVTLVTDIAIRLDGAWNLSISSDGSATLFGVDHERVHINDGDHSHRRADAGKLLVSVENYRRAGLSHGHSDAIRVSKTKAAQRIVEEITQRLLAGFRAEHAQPRRLA